MNTTHKSIVALGAFSMAVAVILGALGAHALELHLDADQLDSFKTGVRYQAWHSITLLVLGLSGEKLLNSKTIKLIATLFSLGILFFSISIYLLNTRELLGIDSWKSVLGPITPVGGILLISAWLLLGYHSLTGKREYDLTE